MIILNTETDGTSHYEIEETLEGDTFRMSFDWNSRDERWYITLRDADGVLVPGFVGVRLAIGSIVGRYNRPDNRPKGELYVYSAGTVEAGLTELGAGQKVELIYFTEEEVNSGQIS